MKDGESREKGEKIVNWCEEVFVKINLDATKEVYEGKNIIKLIDICQGIPEVKSMINFYYRASLCRDFTFRP